MASPYANEWMTVSEAVRLYTVSKSQLHYAIKMGDISSRQPGGYGTRHYLSRDELDRMFFRRRNTTAVHDRRYTPEEEEKDYQDMLSRMGWGNWRR